MEYERQKTERGTGNRRHERRKRIRQAGRQTDRQTEEKQQNLQTLFIASGEDDGGCVVTDQAFGDADMASSGRIRPRPLNHELAADDLHHQVMARGSWLELLHSDEHRLTKLLRLSLRLLLLLLLWRGSRLCLCLCLCLRLCLCLHLCLDLWLWMWLGLRLVVLARGLRSHGSLKQDQGLEEQERMKQKEWVGFVFCHRKSIYYLRE